MMIFEVLIFAAAIVVVYLYWNTPSNDIINTPVKETFQGYMVQNISMCPGQSKAFVGKNGDNLCCDGNPNGTDCEGKTICTLSSVNSKENPSCFVYLRDLYEKKGRSQCPRTIPNYYEDDNGRGFCTVANLNSQLNGPSERNAEKCTVGGKGMSDPTSCEVQVALDKMPCPSRGCSKSAILPQKNKPVVFQAHFRDSGNITRSCYDTNSVVNFWRSTLGDEWSSKTSHINPDRNIMFCSVAKKYFIDKTLTKKDIDI